MTTSFADAPGQGPDLHRQVEVSLATDVSAYTAGIQQAVAATNQLASAIGGAAQQADSLSKRAGKSMAHFAMGDFAALSGATAVASRFEAQLSTLNATAAITGSSMPALKKQISGVFTDFPVWRQQIVALAQAISNLGVTKPQDVGALTRSYTKLGAATGEDSSGLASGGIQLSRQMGNMDPGKIDKYNNALVTLSKNAGVSAQSVTDFAQQLAPFANQLGIGEAKVLGIATAFQKAGADGTYAANAFNQIAQEISQLEKTGSPNLSKYSAFLGKSNQQFKSMSGEDQITAIFEKMSKGGAQAAQFADTLPGGQRTLKAAQQVAQTGDMRSMIAMAVGSSQDTKNLDKGAQAAMSGLGDAVTGVRNEFTELATILGDPLLGPLTKLVNLFGDVVHGVNSLLEPLGKLPAIAMAVAGAVAIPGAVGLAHSGLAAGAGLIRSSLGGNSGWRTVMREGRQVGQQMAGGMSRDEAVAGTNLGKQQLPAHLQALFDQAISAGQKQGPGGGGQNPLVAAFQAGRAGTTGAQATKMQQAAAAAGQAAGQVGQLGLFDKLGNVSAFLTEGQFDPAIEQGKAAEDRKWARKRRGEDVTEGRSGWRRTARSLARWPWQAAESLGDAGGAAARGLRNLVPEGAGGLGTVARAGATAASLGGRAFAGLSSLAGGVASLATGPVGIGAGIATAVGAAVVDSIKQATAREKDVSTALSGASAYDQALDSSSTNLATFSTAVDDAAARLGKFANVPLKDLTGVSAEDIGAVSKGDYKVSDPNLAAIAKASGGSKDAIGAYFDSMGIQAGDLSGDRFTKYKQDLLSTMGVSRANEVTGIMTGVAQRAAAPGGLVASANFSPLGALGGQMADVGTDSNDFKSVIGAGMVGAVSAGQGTGARGQLAQITNMLRLGAESTGTGNLEEQGKKQAAFAEELSKYTSIDPKEFLKQISEEASKQNTYASIGKDVDSGADIMGQYGNMKDAGSVLAAAFANTTGGGGTLGALGFSREQLAAGVQNGMAYPTPGQNDTRLTDLAGRGALGKQLSQLGAVGSSITAPGQGGTAAQATSDILAKAMADAGGDANKAAENLQKLSDQSGGAIDALGGLLSAAAAAASGLGEMTAATQTTAQAAQASFANSNNLRAGLGPDSSDAAVAASGAADKQAQSSAVGLLQYSRGLVMRGRQANLANSRGAEDYGRQQELTNQAYSTQTGRASEDYGTSRSRSQRNFEKSSLRASEDYERSRTRQIEQFGIQQARSSEQYYLQRARQQEDYQTQSLRSEAEYNKSRERQLEDFHTSAERSEEDYQTSRARTIADAALSEARGAADFSQQQARAQADFNLQQQRALADYHTSQARATADFNTQMARQAEDAAKSIYDPFARIQRKGTASAASVVRNLGQQNKAMTKQLSQLQQARDMGLSAEAIKTLNLADPKNAQQLDAMIKGFGSNPNLIKQTNAEVTARIKNSKSLVTSQYSTEYGRQVEDFKKGQARADEDMRKSMGRSEKDFTKSMSRSAADYAKGVRRTRADLSKSLNRSASDYAKSVNRSQKDLHKALTRGAVDFATQVAQGAEDLSKSLSRSATDFATSVSNATDDFGRSLDQASIDFATAQQRAKDDQATALEDMADDFAKTSSRAATDHQTALDNMATAYKTQQTRAAEDLKESFREFTGGFNEVMTEMTEQATGAMQQYAPEAAAAYLEAIQQVGVGVSMMTTIPGVTILIGQPAPTTPGDTGGWNPPGLGSDTTDRSPTSTAGPTGTGFADGGISLSQQYAMVSEKGPEAHIPLNSRGEDFMAGLIAKSLARGITMAISSTDIPTSSTSNTNTISFAGADIQVVASDPNQMARELEAKAKLKRLTSPK